METLKYKIITSRKQYNSYCSQLEELLGITRKTTLQKEVIALLTLLIEKWDSDHNTFNDSDPVQVLKSLMQEHQMNAASLTKLLGVSKGLVSDMLHYKKGFSKESIRKLSDTFKLSHEAFNRPYDLIATMNRKHKRQGSPSQHRRVAI